MNEESIRRARDLTRDAFFARREPGRFFMPCGGQGKKIERMEEDGI